MDKQIIIDGVDVSGCEKQGETIAGITCGNGERIRLANEIITKHKLCKDNPNCVYKQLKRKEQECENWQKELDKTHLLMLEKQDELIKEFFNNDQLKAENEELKEQINCRCFDPKNNNNHCISYNRIAEDYERDLKQLNQLKEDNEELRNAYTRLNSLYNDNCNFTGKLEQSLTEIKEIVKPYQRNIDKICGHCRRYDCCHACCIDDINCYQYKKPTTPACDKYCELKEFEINNMANQVLQKISEVME